MVATDIGMLNNSDERLLCNKPMSTPIVLTPNCTAKPNLPNAAQHLILFQDGIRGQSVIGRAGKEKAQSGDWAFS